MPPKPVPADPGWDEDLTWLDRDPMTAAEFEASLDRLCERDEGYCEEEYEEGALDHLFASLATREISCCPESGSHTSRQEPRRLQNFASTNPLRFGFTVLSVAHCFCLGRRTCIRTTPDAPSEAGRTRPNTVTATPLRTIHTGKR